MRTSLLALAFACLSFVAYAATIEQPLADPAQEQQARALFSELKCVVCEGQSLADSDAKLAIQMRAHVRHMLNEGKTSQEVMAFFRQSYGEQILMTPPLASRTALLWILPVLLLIVGAGVVWKLTRSGRGNHG